MLNFFFKKPEDWEGVSKLGLSNQASHKVAWIYVIGYFAL